MSMTVEVGLLSGRTVTVNADKNELVDSLRLRAQVALGVAKGRLVDSSGSVWMHVRQSKLPSFRMATH